ncbi:MAG TPA: hypothetical protein VHC97_14295 [Thermoanaerobaculia bacterium]|jgi:hypothetical protein|nr:hypothetical protein [Thermoanaerobaculia bacterium]
MYVSVLFRGLCGFVPHIDRKRMQVLLLDLTNPPFPDFLPHSPSIEYDVRDRIDGNVPQHLFLSKDADEKVVRRGLWLLYREHIELWPDGQRPSKDALYIDHGEPHYIKPGTEPDQGNRQFFAWVPSVENILPKACYVDEQFLGEVPSKRLVARVKLVTGTIRTKSFNRTPDGGLLFRFKPDNVSSVASHHVQAVASEVELTAELAASFVDVVSFDFDHGYRRYVRLRPTYSDRVEIVLQNMEINEFVAGCKPLSDLLLKTGVPAKPSGAHDALLYDLSSYQTSFAERPFAHAVPPEDKLRDKRVFASLRTTAAGASIVCPSPPCSGLQFAPSGRA